MKIKAALLTGLLIFNNGITLSYPGEALVDSGKKTYNSLCAFVKEHPKKLRRMAVAAAFLIGAFSIWYGFKLEQEKENLARADIKDYNEIIGRLEHQAAMLNIFRGSPDHVWEIDYRKVYDAYCSSPNIVQQINDLDDRAAMTMLFGVLLSFYSLYLELFLSLSEHSESRRLYYMKSHAWMYK